jgi:hypothetical protein
MWEPVGPLPAAVYWRRRGVAVAAALALALPATWWVATATATPQESTPTTRAALANPQLRPDGGEVSIAGGAAGVDPTEAASAGAPATSVLAGGAAGPVPDTATRPVPTSQVVATAAIGTFHPESAAPTAPPGATSEELQPDLTPRPAPVATPVAVPPTGPVPCTNAMTGVAAEIDRPTHEVGERPVLRLVVTNTSPQPCVRDLDASRQEIVVWSGDGKVRLWSSNDCGNAGSPDLRTLIPGQPVAFAVTWAGRTSAPGCAAARTVVPAGSYRLLTRLDDDISAPTPFQLTP